jgi:hypothetical protein
MKCPIDKASYGKNVTLMKHSIDEMPSR